MSKFKPQDIKLVDQMLKDEHVYIKTNFPNLNKIISSEYSHHQPNISATFQNEYNISYALKKFKKNKNNVEPANIEITNISHTPTKIVFKIKKNKIKKPLKIKRKPINYK